MDIEKRLQNGFFYRKLASNGQVCLRNDFSDDSFPLTVRFRSVGPQTPLQATVNLSAGSGFSAAGR